MSKSKQHNQKKALWRRGQSLPLEPLDSEPRFIDDLMGRLVVPIAQTASETAAEPMVKQHPGPVID